jgi:hypothetical protein
MYQCCAWNYRRPSQGVLYVQFVTRFHGTRLNAISSKSVELAALSLRVFLQNFPDTLRHYLQISCTDVRPNRRGFVKTRIDVSHAFHCADFHETYKDSVHICGPVSCRILPSWLDGVENRGKIPFTPASKATLLQHRFSWNSEMLKEIMWTCVIEFYWNRWRNMESAGKEIIFGVT